MSNAQSRLLRAARLCRLLFGFYGIYLWFITFFFACHGLEDVRIERNDLLVNLQRSTLFFGVMCKSFMPREPNWSTQPQQQ